MVWVINYYCDNVIIYKDQCDKVIENFCLVNDIIKDMQVCQWDVVVLDVKYMKELFDVKKIINDLCWDVDFGVKWLCIVVICSGVFKVIFVFGVDDVGVFEFILDV